MDKEYLTPPTIWPLTFSSQIGGYSISAGSFELMLSAAVQKKRSWVTLPDSSFGPLRAARCASVSCMSIETELLISLASIPGEEY